MKIYLVRHGQTDWNLKNITQGRTDIPLNDTGRMEALKTKELINLDDIDIVFSSPLSRAKETAEIICDNKKDIIFDDRLIERCFGSFEGKEYDRDILRLSWDYNINYDEEGYESLRDILERAKNFMSFLYENYPDKNILIVAHGCITKCLYYAITGYDENTNFREFFLNNCEIKTFDIKQKVLCK